MSIANPNTLIIACGAIAHELVAVIKANQFNHIAIQCLPAEWHNTPDKITPAIEQKILTQRAKFARILIAYGDCGTGGQLDALIEKYNIERLPGDHCYSFFAGQDIFESMAEEELGTFYLTDYLVDNFQRLILDGLGISRFPELREQYFAHYTRVMYLRQNMDEARLLKRMQLARDAADSLQLPLQVHDTALAPFKHALRTINIAVSHY